MASSNPVLLSHRYLFGLKGSVRNNIAYIDESLIVYPCGHNVIIHNTETKEQQFIHCVETGSLGITAICVTPNKRFLAIAEKSERAVISIYDLSTLRKRKTLSNTDIMTQEFVFISFSADGKYCLAQGGAPDWTLSLWAWEKSKFVASVKTTNQHGNAVLKADFCPNDTSIVCITGNGIIKFFKLSDGVFRQQPLTLKRDPPNILYHIWLNDDKVIAATDFGELWLFENFEFRQVLASAAADHSFVSSMATYSKGFICGCSEGILRIYERGEDSRELYKKAKNFRIEGQPHCINNIAVSPSEDCLSCTLQNNQMYSLTLSNTDILKEDAMNFDLVSSAFHAPGPNGCHITGLDTCIRKPLIVTCGLDCSVRVWNYIDKSTDIIKMFKEEAHSVALHPSGLHLLVGFSDKLRFLNVLMDDIRPFKEYTIKGCKEVRFSHGGQYFAAVNNNIVQIYNSYTCEMINVLRGHTNKVNSVKWKEDDRKIVTCGYDGSIFIWDVKTGNKCGEGHTHPRCNYSEVVFTNDMSTIYATGSDSTLKEIDVVSGAPRLENEANALLGPLVMSSSQKVLFIGTIDENKPGSIRAYKVPFGNNVNNATVLEYTTYQCHDLPVTRLRLSHCNQYLFSVGEDGSMCIFETKELVQKAPARGGRERESGMQFAEEILITKSDLEEKNSLMHELKAKVEELTLHNEYQLRLKDMNYKEKIKEVSEKFSAELTQDRQRYFELRDDKRDMEMDYEDKLKEIEDRQHKELQELENIYKSKIEAESDRHKGLEQERDEQNARWEEENQLLVESHTQFLAEMTLDYDVKVESEQELQSKLSNEKDEMVNEFEDGKKQIEEDADIEIEEIKSKYDAKLSAEREATLRLKGENGIMKKKFSALQKDIEDQREEIRSLHEKEKELFENIKGLEKDIQGHKKEIREREETIQDKEKRIYDLKKKNQELEKFKFVLDYKIKELKRQIEPRENEICDMRCQIEEMDQELEQYHKSNAALDLMIGELRLKMDGMQKEMALQVKEIQRGENLIRKFQVDLQQCAQHLEDPKQLKPSIVKIYKKYIHDDNASESGNQNNEHFEYNRQREYLEKSVESLKRKVCKDVDMNRSEKMRLMRENVILTKEVNDLRREYQYENAQLKECTDKKRGNAKLYKGERSSRDQDNAQEIKLQQAQIDQLEEYISNVQCALAGPIDLSNAVRNNDLGRLPPVNSSHSHIDA